MKKDSGDIVVMAICFLALALAAFVTLTSAGSFILEGLKAATQDDVIRYIMMQ